MKKVFIYSNKNAARSQMLEGWLKYYLKGKAEVISAGANPEDIHMLAQKAMMESVIDINKFKSKNITEYTNTKFDMMLVCDNTPADDICLQHMPEDIISCPFDDPSLSEGTDLDRLKTYRNVCYDIEDFALEIAIKHFGLLDD